MRPLLVTVFVLVSVTAHAQTSIRIVPVSGADHCRRRRFDIRVEATGVAGGEAPRGLTVTLDGVDVTARNILAPGLDGQRGRGGTGTPDGTSRRATAPRRRPRTPPTSCSATSRCATAGRHTLTATTADGATATVTWEVFAWQQSDGHDAAREERDPAARRRHGHRGPHGGTRAVARLHQRQGRRPARDGHDGGHRPGDDLGAQRAGHRLGARHVELRHRAQGRQQHGRRLSRQHLAGARARRPGDARDGLGLFDNPRTEYLGALLRRTRGPDSTSASSPPPI